MNIVDLFENKIPIDVVKKVEQDLANRYISEKYGTDSQDSCIYDKNMESFLSCPTFVINLPRSNDRLPYVKNKLHLSGYTNITVYNAVDGLQSSEVEEALKLFHYPKLDNIKPGAVGCLLSHMKLLNHIIEKKILISTIFEDDIHFHPDWHTLCKRYYALTPSDYDVIFIGNQLENSSSLSEITTEYSYCTHAYMVTLEGAKKMLNTILQYNLGSGLCEIDCIIKNVRNKNKSLDVPQPFVLYSWNGTLHPCEFNTSEPKNCRNTGLVFQNMNFISLIDDSKIIRKIKWSPKKKMVML